MCIATRCTSVEQFVQMFHRFVDEDSFFVSTLNTRPAGLETAFSVQLADGTAVLRGHCIVLQSWAGSNSPFKTPGVRLGILRLTASSMHVFEQLLITRSAPTTPPTPTPAPSLDDATTKLAKTPIPRRPPNPTTPSAPPADVKPDEERTPGSDLILPANPLSGINDVALEGFVDCTLYEETGNFFPVDEELAPPPKRSTLPPPISNMSIVNAPVEMSVLAPLPKTPTAAMPGTLASSSISMPIPMPTPTPPPMMLVSPPPSPPPMPAEIMARGTPMPGVPNSPAMPPPLPLMRRVRAATAPLRSIRLPPRRYLIAAGVTLLGIATVAIAASRDSKPAAKPKAIEVAQLDTPKPMHEVVAEPEPPPPPAPTPPAADDDSEPTETNDAPAVIGDGPCKLEVATTPAGSMISLDGKVLAPSPLTVATTCDKHKLDIAHQRYMTSTKLVSLTKPEDKIDVTLGRPTHTVSITSQPSGATIFIDGHRAGTTPTTLSVLGFQQLKLEVKKTGYQPQTTKIYSKVPQDRVSLRLTKW
jgi:hypothetical protein